LSSDTEEINENQFITLPFLKSFLKSTDTQDDNILLEIVKSSNNELKKQLKTVVDDITSIEGTKFFDRAQDTALTFALSKVRRNINQMYDEADKLKANYTSEIQTLLGDVRAIAPKRTSLQVVTRTIPFEEDYFAERHLP
jgi:hypothetical protein